jgi:hypothetical protein
MGHAAQHSDFHMGEGAPSRKAETTHCPAVVEIAGPTLNLADRIARDYGFVSGVTSEGSCDERACWGFESCRK